MPNRFYPIATILFLLVMVCCAPPHAVQTKQSSAMQLRELSPANGAKGVCTDTPLRITFDHPPTLGAGQIRVINAADNSVVTTIDVAAKNPQQTIGGVPHFNYRPVIISGNNAEIYLPNGSLACGKIYSVTVDPGALRTDTQAWAGISNPAGWRFSTKAALPAAQTPTLIVATDGSGDFCTVQGAIDFLPDGNTNRTTLFLRRGTYTEPICFRAKHNITITGEDRQQTVIAYANNARFNPSSEQGYHRGVLRAVGCDGLVISNLTIRNITPRGGSQAEAIILDGNLHSKAILANVDLYSFQDTLQINGQAYISDCRIEGDVDFMWGRGPCFFEACHCVGIRSKAYYAQIRNPATNHGFVYHRCIFDGPQGITSMYINRVAPLVYPHSEMVLIDCILGNTVSPIGWKLDAPALGTTVPTTRPDIHFWEYNSHDPAGKPIDITHRLSLSRQLKSPDDAELIANYSQPSYVLGDHWQAQSDPNLPPVGDQR